MIKVKSLVLCVLSVLMLSSCLKPEYRLTYSASTRKANIYSAETFEAEILWRATYLSPAFREAAKYQINVWEKIPRGEMGNYPGYLMDYDDGSFMVSIYTPRSYPAITDEADNFWEFTLDLPDGRSIVPASVESVRVTRREQKLFPYVDMWSRFYRVKFPVTELARPFSLTLRSAGATSSLTWQ